MAETSNNKNLILGLRLIAFGLIGWSIYNIAGNSCSSYNTSKEVKLLKKEAALYRERIKADSTLIELLKRDEYLIRHAREKHQMQRQNEDIYIIKEK